MIINKTQLADFKLIARHEVDSGHKTANYFDWQANPYDKDIIFNAKVCL